jgi:hypothetical protein
MTGPSALVWAQAAPRTRTIAIAGTAARSFFIRDSFDRKIR